MPERALALRAVEPSLRACCWVVALAACSSGPPAGSADAGTATRDAETSDAGTGDAAGPDGALEGSTCEASPTSAVESTPLPAAGDADASRAASCVLRSLGLDQVVQPIVCSGENNHGVHESSVLHGWVTRYLVQVAGVRLILLETSAADASAWDRYLVSRSQDDLDQGFASARNTLLDLDETEEFIRLLAELNGALPAGETLTVSGFDITLQPEAARERLLDYIARIAPDEVAAARSALSGSGAAAGSADWVARLNDNRAAYVEATDELAFAAALSDAMNLLDGFLFMESYRRDGFTTANARYREPGMIRNVDEQIRAAGTGGVMIISHNWHCAKLASAGTGPVLGTSLAADPTWGPRYFAIGQLYAGGEYLGWAGPTLQALGFQAPADTLESLLLPATSANFNIINIDAMAPEHRGALPWWNHPTPVNASDQFDSLLFARSVTAATLR